MLRASLVLGALTSELVTTSDLYDRVGYAALSRAGLIPYPAFRAELAKLSAAGVAECETGGDGSTLWRLAASSPGDGPLPD
jgi:hypothetical protein